MAAYLVLFFGFLNLLRCIYEQKPMDIVLAKVEKNEEIIDESKQHNEATSDEIADQKFFVSTQFPQFPSSSIYCSGDRENRNRFLFLKTLDSAVENAERVGDGFIDLTSLSQHNAFYWDYVEVAPKFFQDLKTINYVEKQTFLFSRFHVGNIMHTLHDDALGLFYLLQMYANPAPFSEFVENPGKGTFGKNVNIFLYDGWGEGDYGHLLQKFSSNSLLFTKDFENQGIFCFQQIVVGNSKHANWYQYGFGKPQGPIENKKVSGHFVREVSRFFLASYGIPEWKPIEFSMEKLASSIQKSPSVDHETEDQDLCISIFSRTRDRLILNEKELAEQLHAHYSLPVKFIRMEEMSTAEQMKVLTRTAIAIGMHGSLLIMGMFMPRNSILIECFPYAVPAENYTPYKTMAALPGVDIRYATWTNKIEANNYPHPERPAHQGGIQHLPTEEQTKILESPTVPTHFCCTDPYWLFRIYQDTKIQIDELIDLIDKKLAEPLIAPADTLSKSLIPVPVENEVCLYGRQGRTKAIQIRWDSPWNGVTPLFYGIWVHQDFKEFYSNSTDYIYACKNKGEVDFWVRSYYLDKNGDKSPSQYGKKLTCECDISSAE